MVNYESDLYKIKHVNKSQEFDNSADDFNLYVANIISGEGASSEVMEEYLKNNATFQNEKIVSIKTSVGELNIGDNIKYNFGQNVQNGKIEKILQLSTMVGGMINPESICLYVSKIKEEYYIDKYLGINTLSPREENTLFKIFIKDIIEKVPVFYFDLLGDKSTIMKFFNVEIFDEDNKAKEIFLKLKNEDNLHEIQLLISDLKSIISVILVTHRNSNTEELRNLLGELNYFFKILEFYIGPLEINQELRDIQKLKDNKEK